MKKIVLMLAMVMMLAMSAVCSASNGKVLDAEEAIVSKFLNAANYNAVTSMMTEDMRKDFTAETFANFKEQLDKNFGKLNENRLFMVEKHNEADILRCQSKFEKVPEAQFTFLFEVKNEKPLMAKFALALPPKPEDKKAEQK